MAGFTYKIQYRAFKMALLLVALTHLGCDEKTIPSVSNQPPPIQQDQERGEAVQLCTSNIQFLGGSKLRDNEALANIYKNKGCDLVIVQELIAPPDLTLLPNSPLYNSKEVPTYPDGTALRANERNTEFFIAMLAAGYDQFWLSEEDTGTSVKNHSNGTNTEWFVVFYKSQVVRPKLDLPNGFLDADRTANPKYDRVPYAFSFTTVGNSVDFVLINVHLHPGPGRLDRERRKVEITNIFEWIAVQKFQNSEKDYIILGDMNLEDKKELDSVIPPEFVSLNAEAATNTNTNMTSPKPYDHIMISRDDTKEVEFENNFEVINLISELAIDWASKHVDSAYPGDPYNHDMFRFYYTDHHPVLFKMKSSGQDDD
ncbi:MAG: hypothetical protein KDD38_00140 [Bdellovibrionales bacterium]|nr:hypothetical protein [Bdellovibrionales bacterium]